MKLEEKKEALKEKLNKIVDSTEGFDFFLAIYDFVKYIESNSKFFNINLRKADKNKKQILGKYKQLKKIYIAIKDMETETDKDLGHERYMAILDIKKIKNGNFSNTNFFWKKRELYKKIAEEIYEELILKKD